MARRRVPLTVSLTPELDNYIADEVRSGRYGTASEVVFDIGQSDPFMTRAPRATPTIAERIPAAVHVDGTARIQTVERASNPRYYDLIERFGRLTGTPVLINTSFNKQEPIVATPEEALSCYLRTEMDVLVMGNTYTRDRPPEAMRKARGSFEVVEVNTRSGD